MSIPDLHFSDIDDLIKQHAPKHLNEGDKAAKHKRICISKFTVGTSVKEVRFWGMWGFRVLG